MFSGLEDARCTIVVLFESFEWMYLYTRGLVVQCIVEGDLQMYTKCLDGSDLSVVFQHVKIHCPEQNPLRHQVVN